MEYPDYAYFGRRSESVRKGGSADPTYDPCDCGRFKSEAKPYCRACLRQPLPRCKLRYVPFRKETKRAEYGQMGCETEWPHAHCNCGYPCALNWPFCSTCESRSMGMSYHDQTTHTLGGTSGNYNIMRVI